MAEMPSGLGQKEDVPKAYDKLVRATSVSSEQPIFMIATNRWEYMNRYLGEFQEMVVYELYIYILAAIGLILLLMGNFLAIVFLAGAAYFIPIREHRKNQVNSPRRVILGN